MNTYVWLTQEATHHGDVSTVLGNSLVILVAFVLLMVLLNKFAAGPILELIAKREATITQQLEHAQEMTIQAQQHEEASQRVVQEAKQQAQEILAAAKADGEKLKADMLTETKAEIVRLRQEAQDTLEQERQELLRQTTKTVGESTVLLTEKLLKREISAADHQQLINDFIEGLDHK